MEAVETIGGVLTDLVEVAEQLPVPAWKAEEVARILDRLAEEIAEAATMVRPDGSDELKLTRSQAREHARALLAENRQPLLMTPGDLRTLLSRYRQGIIDLLG